MTTATQQELDHFRAFCEEKENELLGECPPEAKAKMASQNKEEAMAQAWKIWDECDANKDGALNLQEWLTYTKTLCEVSLANYGWTAAYDEELMRKGYEVIASYTPDERGVTRDALTPYMKCIAVVRAERA